MHALDWLVTMALEVGPHGRFVLPVAGSLVGLVAFGLLFVVVSQRIAWRMPELVRAVRTAIHAVEEGERATLVGRIRAPGAANVSSFERADRQVVVSSLQERRAGALECIATRSAPLLELHTRSGVVPLDGLLDVRRTRAPRKARNVDDRARGRALSPETLRAADLHDGQWVLASGIVGRVVRERLREQAGVRGLSGSTASGSVAPIVLTALRPELPRWTIPIAIVGALLVGALVTPLPWDAREPLFEISYRPAWCVLTATRLLGPTREGLIEVMPDSTSDPVQREWAVVAARERGDCAQAAWILAASRRDEEALEVIERCDAAIEQQLVRTLLRETGQSQRALAAADATITVRERRVLELEAGQVPAGPLPTSSGSPPSELSCDGPCLSTIRGLGDAALERTELIRPLRSGGLDCGVPEILEFLTELGLACGEHSAADGARAVRLAPRSFDARRPLSEVEVRLHVVRLLLEAGGETAAAAQVRERQRRILAVLSTEGGARGDALLWEAALGGSPPAPPQWHPRDGCMPFSGLTDELIAEQAGFAPGE